MFDRVIQEGVATQPWAHRVHTNGGRTRSRQNGKTSELAIN